MRRSCVRRHLICSSSYHPLLDLSNPYLFINCMCLTRVYLTCALVSVMVCIFFLRWTNSNHNHALSFTASSARQQHLYSRPSPASPTITIPESLPERYLLSTLGIESEALLQSKAVSHCPLLALLAASPVGCRLSDRYKHESSSMA
jgi:hypothetical protein